MIYIYIVNDLDRTFYYGRRAQVLGHFGVLRFHTLGLRRSIHRCAPSKTDRRDIHIPVRILVVGNDLWPFQQGGLVVLGTLGAGLGLV